jgi:beta-lactamase regulating signal transducer with metallopeptidase domain
MNSLSWTEMWFVQLVGQTSICLALGLWAGARLERSPDRAYVAVLLSMLAALVAPIATKYVKETNRGAFLGTAQATVYSITDDQAPIAPGAGRSAVGDVLIAIWASGTFTLLMGIAVSYLRGRRLLARAVPVTESRLLDALAAARVAVGLGAKPDLRSHPEVSSPMVWAWSRVPVALIPDDAGAQMDEVDWESIFIHELAHVARRDHLTGLFADVTAAVLFWNPAVWWCRRRLARQSEFACDDQVAMAGKSAVEFAGSLLALRREALLPRIPATSLTGGRSWLKARVQRLLRIKEAPTAHLGIGWICVATVLTLLVVMALALAQTRSGPRPENSFAAPIVFSASRTEGNAA